MNKDIKLLMHIIEDEIILHGDIDSYILMINSNKYYDHDLYVIAEEMKINGLLDNIETVNDDSIIFYKLTDYFKENFDEIVKLYSL